MQCVPQFCILFGRVGVFGGIASMCNFPGGLMLYVAIRTHYGSKKHVLLVSPCVYTPYLVMITIAMSLNISTVLIKYEYTHRPYI